MSRPAGGPAARDEGGSLIIALAVVLVLSGLALAVLARTVSALGSARVAQDAAAAVSAADAGVADAMYVLDHTTVTGPTTLSGSSASFQWTATVTTAFTATVTSTGSVHQRSRTVEVTASRHRRWPWLVATSGSLVLDGTNTITPPEAVIGAGGAIVVRDAAAAGARQELFGPGASCSGCTAPVVLPATTVLTDPVVPSPAPAAPLGGCTAISSLTAGIYLCSGNVTFAPNVVITGSVELFVTNGYGPPPTVSFAGAAVNAGGDPTALVVHVIGAGVVEPGDGVPGAGSFTGIIDAPRSSLRSADCQFGLTGAMVLGSFDCSTGSSGPGPTLAYDTRVAALPAATWRASAYQDVTGP